jgi:dienelactone hydrolase
LPRAAAVAIGDPDLRYHPRRNVSLLAWASATALAAGAFAAVPGDPVALVRAYFQAERPDARSAVAAHIASHTDYRPSRLRDWLHRGAPFPGLEPGAHEMAVDVGAGPLRRVVLLVPDAYRPDRPWPLVYALHPSGMPAGDWARAVERILGRLAREHVIAAPEYAQNYIAAKPPFVAEHAAILDAVARRVHVDASRVFAFGYSKGGFASWYVALYFPDWLAGAVSIAAGFDVAPADDGFWKLLLGNVARVPVLNVWGERDALVIQDLAGKPAGTFAESNRRFAREIRGMGLPITNLEVPGGEHHRLSPPGAPIAEILAGRRSADPDRIDHAFRHLHQAACYWLEGLTWAGASWGDPPPPPEPVRPGETEAGALARALAPRLGRLTGVRDGQTFRVTRRHVGDVVVWVGERTIDWGRPVTIEVDGQVTFSGRLTPDPTLALARAAASMDFDRLRFAGIRVSASGEATVLKAGSLPEPVWRTGR